MTDARPQPVRLRVERDRTGRPCLELLDPSEWGRKLRKAEVEVPSFVAERWLRAQEAWWDVEKELADHIERPGARRGEGV